MIVRNHWPASSEFAVFGGKLAKRARWRVEHDLHRLNALSAETKAVGLKLKGNPALRDPFHLEERLASLCFDEVLHPMPGDSRLGLATAGATASFDMQYSLRRRAAQAAWFMAVGLLPRQQARTVLSWKLVAASRPKFLTRLSKGIRRAMG